MIETSREKKGWSLRALEQHASVVYSNLFNWLTSTRGGPPPKVYVESLNKRLADALDLDPKELEKAYRESYSHPNQRKFGSKPATDVEPAAPPAPTGSRGRGRSKRAGVSKKASSPPLKESPVVGRDDLERLLLILRNLGDSHYSMEDIESWAAKIQAKQSS